MLFEALSGANSHVMSSVCVWDLRVVKARMERPYTEVLRIQRELVIACSVGATLCVHAGGN